MKYIGDIIYDYNLDKTNGKIIYGAGINGLRVLDFFRINNLLYDFIGFIDAQKAGKYIENFMVINPDEAFVTYQNADYFITGIYMDEMYVNLKKNNIKNIHMLILG